ncbi:hypothetical protein BGZ58_005784 [Dissophora ornata]|nr:hypothetical protein BGZ58_005784 [Dissophora ornata]
MTLKHEAMYMYGTLGEFELPRNNLQLGLLLPALGPLIAIQNNLPDPFAEEDATFELVYMDLVIKVDRKASRCSNAKTSNKKRSGITRGEYVGVEEGLESAETINEHDDTSDETTVDGLKVAKSTGAGNEGKTVGSDNDSDNDNDQNDDQDNGRVDGQVDDQDEEDGEDELTVVGVIQELQELEESEPGFYPLIRAPYHAVSLSPLYIWSGVEIV